MFNFKEFINLDVVALFSLASEPLYLQFKFYDLITKFKLPVDIKNLNLMRIHYFFALPKYPIKDLL